VPDLSQVRSAQLNIESAFPAMATGRFLESEHGASHIRRRQPMGQRPAQHAALLMMERARVAMTLARNHQDQTNTVRVSAVDKVSQSGMRLRLTHSMQIDPCLGASLSSRQAPTNAGLYPHERLEM
jgi:hypothetical protein